MDIDYQRESHVTRRCTTVAGLPLPDGKFTSRDIGDTGHSANEGHIMMLKWLTYSPYMVLLLVFVLMRAFAQEPQIHGTSEPDSKAKPIAPAFDPPQILVAAAIDDDDNLILVNFRTIYIGFTGESYNSRSVSKTSLKEVQIVNVKGEKVSIAAAREQLAGRDTPILCSSWNSSLPDFYASMFSPTTLHFVFPTESPVWEKIQEPGRPIR